MIRDSRGLSGPAASVRGECLALAPQALDVDLHDVAHRAGGAFASKAKPPTTRVSVASAAKLKSAGFDTDQFGKLHVMSVSALP